MTIAGISALIDGVRMSNPVEGLKSGLYIAAGIGACTIGLICVVYQTALLIMLFQMDDSCSTGPDILDHMDGGIFGMFKDNSHE